MDMNTKELTQRDAAAQAVNPLVPPVDIVEDAEGITLRADLPGVDRENLNIGVEGETLTLEATVSLGESAGIQPVYSEIRVAQYRRSFVLGRDLDPEKIAANFANGVLELRIPKREAAKPQRVQVKVA